MQSNAYLYLENGDFFIGNSVGYHNAESSYLGEIVFNTSMTGYQEILTDPSYCSQVVIMTYPLIGNYGINKDDYESMKPALKGLVLRDDPAQGSNWRNEFSLSEFLKRNKIPAISGIDTRMLTKKIRNQGSMKVVICHRQLSNDEIKNAFNNEIPINLINQVSLNSPIHFPGDGKRIVMMDFGYKKNILRSLLRRNCDVVVVPWNTKIEQIESYRPQGILLSNGPGDPTSVPEVLPVIQELQKKFPLFGICMGHQLFALANGAKTQKLKFGHRGANHPVKDLELGKVFMTSQNHGYAVIKESVSNSDLLVSQVNVNDDSVEGLSHKHLPAFSVQYHPEASPGPEDTNWLFDHFLNLIRS
jgi:carbamoyl-phosphate synthase small subunit